jgi:hypothetical protein
VKRIWRFTASLKTIDLAGGKVAKVMLSAGNDKLQERLSSCAVLAKRQKVQQKLARFVRKEREQGTAVDKLAAKEQKWAAVLTKKYWYAAPCLMVLCGNTSN